MDLASSTVNVYVAALYHYLLCLQGRKGVALHSKAQTLQVGLKHFRKSQGNEYQFTRSS